MGGISYNERALRKMRILGVSAFFLILILFILLGGIRSIIPGLNKLEPQKYTFEVFLTPDTNITAGPKGVLLDDFHIYYNSASKEAKISLKIVNTDWLNNLKISVPSTLKRKKVTWGVKNATGDYSIVYEDGTDYVLDNKDDNTYSSQAFLSTKTRGKNGWTDVDLVFEGELYPNAEIIFSTTDGAVLPSFGEEEGAFLKFSNANLYDCSREPCYDEDPRGRYPVKIRNTGNDTISVHTPEKSQSQGWEPINTRDFRLSYDERINKWQRLLDFLLGAMAGPCAILVQIIFVWYYKHKYRRKI